MKPDDSGGQQRNVLGGLLGSCSEKPMTGFFRDGCCNTSDEDVGSHTVCVVATAGFLAFSKASGNDLSTPRPEFGFAGLQPGDRWCLCAARWRQALLAYLRGNRDRVMEAVAAMPGIYGAMMAFVVGRIAQTIHLGWRCWPVLQARRRAGR